MGAYVSHYAVARLPKGPETEAYAASVADYPWFEFDDLPDCVQLTVEVNESLSYGAAGGVQDALERAGQIALEPFEDAWGHEDERGTDWHGAPEAVARKQSELAAAEILRLYGGLDVDHAAEVRAVVSSVQLPWRQPAAT